MPIAEKLKKTEPKRLLALDGGGIRGMLSIEVLAKIEALLQAKLGRDDGFVLADYFDYIAGTSTGAIIATCLSLGMRVSQVRSFYEENGREMFSRASILKWAHYKYEDAKLAAKLREVLGKDTTLGSDRVRTLLLLVMCNVKTDSPWLVSNNPYAKYNERTRPDCNLDLPLWQLIRASTAAPTFFPPEIVTIGPRDFIFVDGGVTAYNNPAFMLFLMATMEPYRLCWPTGEKSMLLVSVGTGATPTIDADLEPSSMHLVYNAKSVPYALMHSALNEQDLLCRTFGRCMAGDLLDRELGDLRAPFKGPVEPRLFTYLRYNAELTADGLRSLGLKQDIAPERVRKLDSVEHIDEIKQVGRAVAMKVLSEHFDQFVP